MQGSNAILILILFPASFAESSFASCGPRFLFDLPPVLPTLTGPAMLIAQRIHRYQGPNAAIWHARGARSSRAVRSPPSVAGVGNKTYIGANKRQEDIYIAIYKLLVTRAIDKYNSNSVCLVYIGLGIGIPRLLTAYLLLKDAFSSTGTTSNFTISSHPAFITLSILFLLGTRLVVPGRRNILARRGRGSGGIWRNLSIILHRLKTNKRLE